MALRSHPGYSLAEIVLVLVITALLSLIAVKQVGSTLDRIATRDSARSAGDLISRARDEAIALHTLVYVTIDTLSDRMELKSRDRHIAWFDAGASQGVSLRTSRDSIAFDARGLGYGAANLTLVVSRGHAVDTVVVSRLGRVR
jgi:Tfp pilus assembly protein FimT